jgi:hypothetical protein
MRRLGRRRHAVLDSLRTGWVQTHSPRSPQDADAPIFQVADVGLVAGTSIQPFCLCTLVSSPFSDAFFFFARLSSTQTCSRRFRSSPRRSRLPSSKKSWVA